MIKPSSPPVDSSQTQSRWSLLGSALGPFLALGIVVSFFGIADGLQPDGGKFLSAVNLRAVSVQTATVAVAALGMTVIVIAGGIDLSAGTSLALCATVLAWCLKEDAAMLLVHGDSVTSAERKLSETKERLGRIPRDIDRLKRAKQSDQNRIDQLEAEQADLNRKLPDLEEHLEEMIAASSKITPYTPALAVVAGILTGMFDRDAQRNFSQLFACRTVYRHLGNDAAVSWCRKRGR